MKTLLASCILLTLSSCATTSGHYTKNSYRNASRSPAVQYRYNWETQCYREDECRKGKRGFQFFDMEKKLDSLAGYEDW